MRDFMRLWWNGGQLDGESQRLHISPKLNDGKASSVETKGKWL